MYVCIVPAECSHQLTIFTSVKHRCFLLLYYRVLLITARRNYEISETVMEI